MLLCPKRIILLFIILISPVLHAGSAQQELRSGIEQLNAQQPAEALKHLQSAAIKHDQGDRLSDDDYINLKASLATAYLYTGDMNAVEQTASALLPVIKQRHGEASLAYVTMLEMLALSGQLVGDYQKALLYFDRLVPLQAKINNLAAEHRVRVLSLKSIAHKELGDYIDAIEAEEAALAIRLSVNPEGDDEVLNSLFQLSTLAAQLGDSQSQIAYLQRQYQMSRRLHGEQHATTLLAKDWLEQVQADKSKVLSGNDATISNLSMQVIDAGRLSFPAEEVKKLEKVFNEYGEKHPLTLDAICRYADSLAFYGESQKAIKYYQHCLKEYLALTDGPTEVLASLYLRISYAHNNLYWRSPGDEHWQKAIAYSKQAVSEYANMYGDSHIRTIVALNHHWQLNRFKPENEYASYELALRTWRAYSDVERKILPYLDKQQRLGFRSNFSALQDNFLESAWVISRKILYDNAFGESYFWDELDRSNKESSGTAATFADTIEAWEERNKALEEAGKKDAAVRRARDKKGQEVITRLYDEWINYKGSLNAVENSLRFASLSDEGKRQKELIEKILNKRKQIAALRTSTQADSASMLFTAQKQMSVMLQRLYKNMPSIKADLRLSTRDIVQSLDTQTVFIDFARYTDNEYMVFIVEPHGRVEIRRLSGDFGGYWGAQIKGVSTQQGYINTGIRKVRDDIDKIINGQIPMQGSDDLINAELEKLYSAIMLPISDITEKYSTLVISPDGLLSLLPLSILRDKRTQRYLVEDFIVRSIPSAREWLRLNNKRTKTGTASRSAVYANPDFNAGSVSPPGRCASSHASRSARDILVQNFKNDCITALPATADEAKTISKYVPGMRNFQNEQASEELLLKETSPQILHIATHGFFISNPLITNPLEKSGLILSGANTSLANGTDEGIVTGLKLAAIDLSATELVVLSACETGVGDIQHGEGVAGLNQAFIRAGASGIVMSLWRVPDRPTAELMSRLYESMADGVSAAAALRLAQLKFIQQKAHPLAWAAFIYNG